MEKITKKQIKQIRSGNHATLMECLEFLLDSYEEDKYELGYDSCVADLSVHAQRLAKYITKTMIKIGKTAKEMSSEDVMYVFDDTKTLAKVIEDYFNTIIKKNE
jgi:translation elongation factor EF-Ts